MQYLTPKYKYQSFLCRTMMFALLIVVSVLAKAETRYDQDHKKSLNHINFFPKNAPFQQDRMGEALYTALDNNIAPQSILIGAVATSIDSAYLPEPVTTVMNFIKKESSRSWGQCGTITFQHTFKAETCLEGGAVVRLNSSYSMDEIRVTVEWEF